MFLTVADQTTSTTLTDTATTFNGIWGEIFEEGLRDTVSIDGTDLTTATVASATFRTRYRSDLVGGETVVDDLGRTWNVESSRMIRDRRYIEYDLQRLVGESS